VLNLNFCKSVGAGLKRIHNLSARKKKRVINRSIMKHEQSGVYKQNVH
jgi:hypothetical protein